MRPFPTRAFVSVSIRSGLLVLVGIAALWFASLVFPAQAPAVEDRAKLRTRDLELLLHALRSGEAYLLREGHELIGHATHPAPYWLAFSVRAIPDPLAPPGSGTVVFDAPSYWLAEDARGLPAVTAEARAKLVERVAKAEGWVP